MLTKLPNEEDSTLLRSKHKSHERHSMPPSMLGRNPCKQFLSQKLGGRPFRAVRKVSRKVEK
ncbi:hypothetical protein SpiGrapes_1405 [Sphaerochaeta pleomorpha str. Grapes]|uniref:Uncharacterized protein n=1 Tax=Sphaerochaeta pleomorpha (strain ATCC BAA-1885 / DSM 22778 / Grapes) TaxID=158190 RepID=G8QUI3_SPHPG|nr:hypothetical protein SpiGrapes_1405 [Sphaerochaeta pleomorpha str. Grapes]